MITGNDRSPFGRFGYPHARKSIPHQTSLAPERPLRCKHDLITGYSAPEFCAGMQAEPPPCCQWQHQLTFAGKRRVHVLPTYLMLGISQESHPAGENPCFAVKERKGGFTVKALFLVRNPQALHKFILISDYPDGTDTEKSPHYAEGWRPRNLTNGHESNTGKIWKYQRLRCLPSGS